MSKNTDLGSLINYIKGQVTGRLNAPAYTSATAFTGTIAGYLGFDTSGNILTSTAGFTGSGTTNYVTKFTGSTSLGNSLIYDNGTNVGIGTTAPTTIAGFTALTIDNYSSGSFIDLNNSGSMNFRFLSLSSIDQRILANSNLALYTAGIKRFNISSIGNIGVGNDNNTYKLDVTGDVNISGTYRVNGTAIGGVTGSGTTNYIPKFTGTTALGNSQIFDNGTNVGIGTASPLSALNSTTTIIGTLIVQTSSVGANYNENIRLNRNSNNSYASIALGGAYNSTTGTGAGQWAFYTDPLASGYNLIFDYNGSEKMRLDSSGRLGLGTTSTSGYAMTVVGVDGTNYSPSSIYKIITRFVNNTSENRGIGIGYHTNTDVNYACIYTLSQGSAAFPQTGLAFGVYNRSTSAYVIRMTISETTVKITNIPTSDAGLGTGDLYRDTLGYVKIAL
jgi:hypothetical protein